jgi:uncharacterized membrane protein HdeD (DUF308 family)
MSGLMPSRVEPSSTYCGVRAAPVDCQENKMIILGIILLIIGFIAKIAILWSIGIILVVVGLILVVLGSLGRAVGGRRHYY